MPFKWPLRKEKQLCEKLGEFTFAQQQLKIELDGFGCFEPRVIFVKPKQNKALNQLQSNLQKFAKTELNLFNANHKSRPFHPHMTIAFRDLKKVQFRLAWEEFAQKEFKGAFVVNGLCLLKHNGKSRDVFEEFILP